MSSATWPDEHNKVIRRHLDEIARVRQESHFISDARIEILAQRLVLPDVKDLDERHSVVRKALKRWKGYTAHTPATFRQALNTELGRFLAQPLHDYTVLFFLNCDPRSLAGRRSFSVLGHRLLIRTRNSIRRNFAVDELWRQSYQAFLHQNQSLYDKVRIRFTPISVKGTWHTEREAVNIAAKSFDLLRVLLNFYWEFQKPPPLVSGGPPQPLAKMLPSPIYGVFGGSGGYVTHWYTVPLPKYEIHSLAPPQIAQVDRIARELGTPTGDGMTAWLLTDVLLKYGLALDTPDWRSAFLTLWQCLEHVSHNSDRARPARSSRGIRPIKVIFQEMNPKRYTLIADLLNTLRETRNNLVHEGLFPDKEFRQIFFIKYIVEIVIEFLLDNLKMLDTPKKLREFYAHRSCPPSDLTMRRDIIETILARYKKAKSK
jgi:hypothetical protein